MKNQYFGDKRDLFKYDIITRIMATKSFLLKQFLFIPMLTPNDSTWEGELRDFKKTDPGFNNENLRKNYLNPAHNISKEQRDFRKIAKYFSDEKIDLEIYHNKDEKYFTEGRREKYFNNITDDYFQKASLIFLDPDKGMEIKNSSDKHVLYFVNEDKQKAGRDI